MKNLALATTTMLALFPTSTLGHGHLTHPPSRNGGSLALGPNCSNSACLWFTKKIYASIKVD